MEQPGCAQERQAEHLSKRLRERQSNKSLPGSGSRIFMAVCKENDKWKMRQPSLLSGAIWSASFEASNPGFPGSDLARGAADGTPERTNNPTPAGTVRNAAADDWWNKEH